MQYHTKETEGSMTFATSQTADLNNLGNTGSDLASFDLGVITAWLYRDRTYDLEAQTWDLYAQDSWKITDKFTLNYGLRWDLLRNPAFTSDFPTTWDFGTGKYLVGTTPVPPCGATQPAPCLSDPNNAYVKQNVVFTGNTKLRSDDYKLFGPRLGLAYKVTSSMVVRASLGAFARSAVRGHAAGPECGRELAEHPDDSRQRKYQRSHFHGEQFVRRSRPENPGAHAFERLRLLLRS